MKFIWYSNWSDRTQNFPWIDSYLNGDSSCYVFRTYDHHPPSYLLFTGWRKGQGLTCTKHLDLIFDFEMALFLFSWTRLIDQYQDINKSVSNFVAEVPFMEVMTQNSCHCSGETAWYEGLKLNLTMILVEPYGLVFNIRPDSILIPVQRAYNVSYQLCQVTTLFKFFFSAHTPASAIVMQDLV